MRRTEFAMDQATAHAFVRKQTVFTLAGTRSDGQPVIRRLHGAVHADHLVFHGAPKGEKVSLVDTVVAVTADEFVATVPSWFFDPERACPATTYYRSVMLRDRLSEVQAPAARAAALAALMRHLQPSGGYAPITAHDDRYRAALAGLRIMSVPLTSLTGKAKLAQNRKPHEVAALLESLWQRGEPHDAQALELLLAANPQTPRPAWLCGPCGATLHVAPGDADIVEMAAAVAALLQDSYWNTAFSVDEIARAHLGAQAWVVARDAEGAVIGSARALSDGAKLAWIYDVIVAPAWRGRGLGKALVPLLLAHPRVRGAHKVMLGTRDAQGLYARFGFVPRPTTAEGLLTTDMVYWRRASP